MAKVQSRGNDLTAEEQMVEVDNVACNCME